MLILHEDDGIATKQLRAVVFHLIAFAYVDGEFDGSEKDYIDEYVESVISHHVKPADSDRRKLLMEAYHSAFASVTNQVDHFLQEPVANKEKQREFVISKLRLKCFELFRTFDKSNQQMMIQSFEELILADGRVDPAERKFFREIVSLVQDGQQRNVVQATSSVEVIVMPAKPMMVAPVNFPELGEETHYSNDRGQLKAQLEADRRQMKEAIELFQRLRSSNQHTLKGVESVKELVDAPFFLDGTVYFHPEDGVDATVVGDLHGCFSCLKAVVEQSQFRQKVQDYKRDPSSHPKPLLVFLGDYIDRGFHSFNGVLRGVISLLLEEPEHVVLLRGNHEYYVKYKGHIYSGVNPSEAMATMFDFVDESFFKSQKTFFENLPTSLLLGRFLFAHAGIPRSESIRTYIKDLSGLNHNDIAFEMMWSDPSLAPVVPETIQAGSVRFSFGQTQFEEFMELLGCDVMFRGHERTEEGFRDVYPGSVKKLFNVFSCGGADNKDLPARSNYREVTPMACSLITNGDQATVTPWLIDYKTFNQSKNNKLYATTAPIPFRKRL